MWKISALHLKPHATCSKHCYRSQRLLHVPTQWWHLGCRKMSPVFPASNALSSSHSRADDRNKGVDPRPVIIIWEGRCKATHFSGLKPRRKEGRSWGWGGCIWSNRCTNWQRSWLKTKSQFFPVFTIATKPRGQIAIALSMNTCTVENAQNPELLQVKQAGLNEAPFQFFFYPNQYQNMKIFQKKTLLCW